MISRFYIGIYGFSDMKNNVIVMVITMVIVSKPIGRAVVYFNIANPNISSDFNFCVEKVGSRVCVG